MCTRNRTISPNSISTVWCMDYRMCSRSHLNETKWIKSNALVSPEIRSENYLCTRCAAWQIWRPKMLSSIFQHSLNEETLPWSRDNVASTAQSETTQEGNLQSAELWNHFPCTVWDLRSGKKQSLSFNDGKFWLGKSFTLRIQPIAIREVETRQELKI